MFILFLARIVPEKGLHYLIDAYKQIETDKKLVIAGGASHSNNYLKKIKAMIKDNPNIIMTGFVQGKLLEELYSNCYLYCLPSDIEGMPLSLLEAMSYGCECLVSNIEENINVVNGYGFSFKKANVKDLKEVMEKMLNNSNRKKEEISNYVIRKYSWEKNVKESETLYNKSIRKRR